MIDAAVSAFVPNLRDYGIIAGHGQSLQAGSVN